jgi:pimeloyl-ACP methyl ester carboxylesterase
MIHVNTTLRRVLQIAKWGCLVLVALGTAGGIYQISGEASDRRAYPPPGRLHHIEGFAMHLHCTGQGTPTVILEAGNGGITSTWGWIQPQLAVHTRVCSYDRAGLGWSDERPGPRDAETVVRQLGSLLDVAGEPGPYVHVGHSMGGLYGRMFAAQLLAEVVGLVLVDASHPDQFNRFPEAIARRTAMHTKAMRLAPSAARMGLVRATNIFGRMAEGLPSEDYARAVAMSASVRSVRTATAEFDAWDTNAAQLATAPSLKDLPIAIITASEAPGAPEGLIDAHHANQRDLARLSTQARHEIIPGANHLSLLTDQRHAQATSRLILDLLDSVRGM